MTRPVKDAEKRVLLRLRKGPLAMKDWRQVTPHAASEKALQVHIYFLRKAGCVIETIDHRYHLVSTPPGVVDVEMEIPSGPGFGDGVRFVREGNAVSLLALADGSVIHETLMPREKVQDLIAFLKDAIL